jgi:hypothetical protein
MAVSTTTFKQDWGQSVYARFNAPRVLSRLNPRTGGEIGGIGSVVNFRVNLGGYVRDTSAATSFNDANLSNIAVPIDKDKCIMFKISKSDVAHIQGADGTVTEVIGGNSLLDLQDAYAEMGETMEADFTSYLQTVADKPVVSAGDSLTKRMAIARLFMTKQKVTGDLVLSISPEWEADLLVLMAGQPSSKMAEMGLEGYVGRYMGMEVFVNPALTNSALIICPRHVFFQASEISPLETVDINVGFGTGFKNQFLYGYGTTSKQGTQATDTTANCAKFVATLPLTSAQTARA